MRIVVCDEIKVNLIDLRKVRKVIKYIVLILGIKVMM